MIINIDNYILIKKISHGNIGSVYLGIHKDSLEIFAIKIIDCSIKSNLIAFHNELNLLQKCDHPNIISIHNHGLIKIQNQIHYKIVSKDIGFLVLDLLQYSIKDLISKTGIIDEIQVLLWSKDIVSALKYLENNSIIHRDLSPSNIMIKNNKAYIIDFGLATIKNNNIKCSKNIKGTLNHVSPEQILNLNNHSILNDLYSLGSIMFYMLTKKYLNGNIVTISKYIQNKKYSIPQELFLSKSILSDDVYELISDMTKPIKLRPDLSSVLMRINLMLVQKRYKNCIGLTQTPVVV